MPSRCARLAFLLVVALVAAACTSSSPQLAPNETRSSSPVESIPAPTTTRRTIPIDRLVVGWTHTQYSIDPDNSAAANDAAIDILRDLAPVQNQHIMGFGALNPEPSKGVYDWTTLDYRMNAIRRSGAIPVITLCCAPDWMKGGKAGSTDWSRLEAAPLPDFFDDFANLSAEVAKRYPDVDYFLVWNELKGFFDNAQNRWQYELYVELYNKVYAAVKKVRPTAKIGGPYVVVDTVANPDKSSHPSSLGGAWGAFDQRPLDVIDYFLEHATGADFIVIDGGLRPKNAALTTDPVRAVDKFGAIQDWIRAKTKLPIWWAEFYPQPTDKMDDATLVASTLRALDEVAAHNGSVVLLWGPNCTGSTTGLCLFSDTQKGNVKRSPLAQSLATWNDLPSPVPTSR
ncbi:MAG: xylan 1,4-beta-xylosidase [Acidimicrobiales bacterium]